MSSDPRLPLVVVVDDELPILRSVERLLRSEPCEVIATQDPREALALAGLRTVDVVVTDHKMPAMTGAQLVGSLAMFSPSTSTVLLTGYPDAADLTPAARRQVRRLIAKPWDDRELLRTVRDCLPFRPRTVACAGRTRAEILPELSRAVPTEPGTDGERTWIFLAGLCRVRDSVSKLLSELVRLAERRSARLLLSDEAGLTSTYLEAIANCAPLVAAAGSRRAG